jgi:hypothetical protein
VRFEFLNNSGYSSQYFLQTFDQFFTVFPAHITVRHKADVVVVETRVGQNGVF